MANKKITALPAATSITSDDLVPIVDGVATTQKATFQQVLDYVTGSTFNDLTVTSLTASVSGTLVGDGSGITGVTAEWDGTHVGDAQITGSLFISGSGNSGILNARSDTAFFSDGERNILFVTGSGRVGIGVSDPAYPLDVDGEIRFGVTGVGRLYTDGGKIALISEGSRNIQLQPSSSVALTATPDGDVGIGPIAPAAKLDVGGSTKFGVFVSDIHQITGTLDVNGSLIADVALSGAVGSEITSTSYTLSADDRGKTLLFSSSATQGITCSSGLSVGYNSTFIQLGSGQLELSASGGVSVLNRQSHTKSAGLYAAVSVVIVSADTYILAGDTSA